MSPRTTDNPRKHMAQTMLSDDELQRLDDWAWERRIRSRSDAIRQLIERGYTVAEDAPKPESKKPARPKKNT